MNWIYNKKMAKGARAINRVTGGTNLSKYIGESLAKKGNPGVKRTVTKKQAYQSAGKVAMSVATLAIPASRAAKNSATVSTAGRVKNAPGYSRQANIKVKGQKRPMKHYNRGTNPNSLK